MDKVDASNGADASTANAETQGAVDQQGDAGSEVNARLLAESKKHKALASELKTKLAKYEAAEKSALEQQSQFKDLYEKEKKDREALLKTVVSDRIKASVAQEAAKHGCIDVDGLLKLGNKELLQYDEATLEVHGVDQYVEDTKKSKPYLFQSASKANINPATPGASVRSNVKPLKDLSKDEIMAQLRALK